MIALESKGIKNLPEDQLITILQSIKSLTEKGYTVQESIDLLLKENQDKRSIEEILLSLEKKINDLERENQHLRDLIQVYLSRINSLEEKITLALPKPRKSIFEKIKDLLKPKK